MQTTPTQSLQVLDICEAEKEFGLVPHALRCSCSLMLDARAQPPADFMESLRQVMVKLFPDQGVWLSTENSCRLDIQGRDVFVEVTSFEPVQDIVVNWNLKVHRFN